MSSDLNKRMKQLTQLIEEGDPASDLEASDLEAFVAGLIGGALLAMNGFYDITPECNIDGFVSGAMTIMFGTRRVRITVKETP